MTAVDIDRMLVTVGMGRYQFVGCVLFGLMLMYSNVSPFTFVFTAGDLKYRCEIPECDGPNAAERIYEPEWLRFTTPYRNDAAAPRKCERYALLSAPAVNGTQCVPWEFDGNASESCGGRWVFEEYENTIGTEFGLMCEEQKWKLATVGSLNNFGQFVGIPISGIIADKYIHVFSFWLTFRTHCKVHLQNDSYWSEVITILMYTMYKYNLGPVTIVLKMDFAMSPKRQPKTEDMDISENIQIKSTIHESFNTFKIMMFEFGRKFTMVFCAVTSAMICIIQSFSINYPMFLILELLSSTVSSGIYTVTFVLAMELFMPKQRVFYYSILECFLPIGGVLVAVIASQVKDWRLLLRISNVPALLFLSYFWLTEESMRWMQVIGKHDRVIEVLKKMAVVNKKPIPKIIPNAQPMNKDAMVENNVPNILKDIICSPTILWRMIRCSLVWIAVTLVYYGLTINATDFAGNKYLNFILVSLVEIPACFLNWMIMEKMSRKMSLSFMFILSGFTSIMFNLTPDSFHFIKLSMFLLCKLFISVAFSIIYILTAEIFPTQMRTTMISMCSMFGRIGSILAPQTTLLADYFGGFITMSVFGLTALVAAAITTTLPESKNIKLPDTIDEAEHIGTNIKIEIVRENHSP